MASDKPKRENPKVHKMAVDMDAIFAGIYGGKIHPSNLPKDLYLETAKTLKDGIRKGYGGTKLDFDFNTPDYEMLKELEENIYMFSGAKTFQQTLEMTDALVNEEGNVRSFKEFKEEAQAISDRYNGEDLNQGYLKTEYDTAIGQSRAAAKWVDIEKNKELLPYLLYSAVMDDHTCEICEPLDGICLPVDDPFWDDNMPLNHFNCECVVEQIDEQDAGEEGISEEGEVSEAVSKSSETKNPLFDMNAGKDKEIFSDTGRNKHPYFEVPERYRELAKENFGLPIPEGEIQDSLISKVRNSDERERIIRAKKVDLLTLPSAIAGTNCGNCMYINSEKNFCTNHKVRQAVSDRMCCAIWDAKGAKREWE